jgi:hypothetical protein
MDEAPIYGSRSKGMVFDLCDVHPSLWCQGPFESRVDGTGDGTKSAGCKLGERYANCILWPLFCSSILEAWQTTRKKLRFGGVVLYRIR